MNVERVRLLRLALETYRADWFEALCACDAAGVARAIESRRRVERELATLEGEDGHDETGAGVPEAASRRGK